MVARLRLVVGRVTIESLQGVLVLVETDAAGERQSVSDVPGRLPEGGLITIDTLLVGQPYGIADHPRNAQAGCKAPRIGGEGVAAQARYRVLLPDLMHLALREQACDRLDGPLLRGADPELMAPLGVAAFGDHEFLRHHEVTGRIFHAAVAPCQRPGRPGVVLDIP